MDNKPSKVNVAENNRSKLKYHILGMLVGGLVGGFLGAFVGGIQTIGGGFIAGVIIGEIIGVGYAQTL